MEDKDGRMLPIPSVKITVGAITKLVWKSCMYCTARAGSLWCITKSTKLKTAL